MRVVLDTNVVVSALIFQQGRLTRLREAWQSGPVVPLVCKETITELMRVLAYPKFRLENADRVELLADYLPYSETVRLTADRQTDLPRCRDLHDQIFLNLAKTSKASALVTGDADLLSLDEHFPVKIIAPADFLVSFADQDSDQEK